jgi:phosphohistidine swiveling domain-containing protein
LLLRDTLELFAQRYRLESGDIYFLYPRELPNLVDDPQSMLHLIRSRKLSFQNYGELALPNVIRETDVENLGFATKNDEDFNEAKGKFLAEGPRLEGTVVNIDEFQNIDDANTVIQQYAEKAEPVILVASQMNLSHDPLIARAAGLIIENAGIVAHGAQRARELGRGAIGGIKGKLLKTGSKILFDPATRSIKKIV